MFCSEWLQSDQPFHPQTSDIRSRLLHSSLTLKVTVCFSFPCLLAVFCLCAVWTHVEEVDYLDISSLCFPGGPRRPLLPLQPVSVISSRHRPALIVQLWIFGDEPKTETKRGWDESTPPPPLEAVPPRVQFSPFLGGDCDGKKTPLRCHK